MWLIDHSVLPWCDVCSGSAGASSVEALEQQLGAVDVNT
jgi:hypothetical protein